MNKYFPVYAAILAIIALFLFLSPQIAKFISADTPQAIELLKNNDFASEALNNQVWIRKTSDQANLIKTVSGVLRIENLASLNATSYTLLSQGVKLRDNALYHIRISYDQPNQVETDASVGIQKNNYTSPYALIFPLEKGSQTNDFYFQTDSSFKNPYFYLYLSGQGNILINSVSLTESSDRTITPSQPSKSNTLDIAEMSSGASATTTAKVGPSPTTTASSMPTTSAVPSASAINAATSLSTDSGKAIFYSGWSVIGFESNTTADSFSKNNLTAYQCFGGQWSNSANSSVIFSANAGALVYSGNKDTKNATLESTESQASATATLGWNLLYNSSDQEIADQEFKFSDGKSLPKSYSLKKLADSKNASSEVYLVSGSQNGVSLNKISFPKEAIPKKTVFWFYLKTLP